MNLRVNLIFVGFLIALLFSLKTDETIAQNTSIEVKKAFQTGNARMLSTHFGDIITLNITGEEVQCSKEEARERIHTFFITKKLSSFEIKFEGKKHNSNFLIGTLYTNSERFRVNIFFKKNNGKNHIHLLRIEKYNGSEI